MPSFESLRAQGRRSRVDVLVPERPAALARTVRPPEYRDLLLAGVHVLRWAAAQQERLLPAPLRGPWRRLRRLLDDVA